ncbi:DeoR/GlpR family DNA-binding transcription regulator [Abyssibius alkaniclasticus]|uniref:DeoR/GlpR family DNA-binding transcription regulator n=1 Tax=Abyssibius alkaniclasticus TaxID=2881234 RepID=UPI0023631A89|nr:DeoR/GlpR family DNA-binding transcription regulator [Abyssibius alkaniclasticus]UPH72241.1 DeoR/GlpR family DNA-binding transcription regulator [Abyssibius alkaniclasticus]
MIRAERHERILAELARRGTVSAQDLATLLDASLATIRRDIAELSELRAVTRTHGGASLPQRREELPFDAKVMSFLPEKRRIGAHVGSMIAPGSTIALGGGTTVMQILPAIRRMELKLVTTAVNVALDLRDASDVAVTLTGGTLRRRTAEMVGHIAERTLRDVNFDIAVIGVDGIDAQGGLTTYDSSEAYVNRVMLEQAREVWIVADHSKFGQCLPAQIAPLEGVSKIITDTGASDAMIADAKLAGIEVLRV